MFEVLRGACVGPSRGSRRRGRVPPLLVVGALAVSTLVLGQQSPASAAQPPQQTRTFGSVALQPSDPRSIGDMAIDDDGLVYLLEVAGGSNADGVAVYDGDGAFVRRFTVLSERGLAWSPVNDRLYTANGCEVIAYTTVGAEVGRFGSCGTGNGQLSSTGLESLAVAPDGTVYVNDVGNDRVQAFDPTGTFLRKWGSFAEFPRIVDLVVGPTGDVFTVDATRDRVSQYTSTGTLVRSWGSSGAGDGQFTEPLGIVVSSGGDIYVTDQGSTRVQRFNAMGTFQSRWGAAGDDPGQFGLPHAIEVGPSGAVFVGDDSNRRVERFSATGAFEREWGYWTVPGRLRLGQGISRAPSGDFFVTDQQRDLVMVFDTAGAFVRSWGNADNADGVLRRPTGIAVAGNGDVFVVDTGHHRIQRYDSVGNQLGAWGTQGSGPGQLKDPTWLALDGLGNAYVSDTGNRRIQEFTTAAGSFVREWGSSGTGNGQFTKPKGIAVGPSGDVYAVDDGEYLDRVQRFTPQGSFVTAFGTSGTSAGQLQRPEGLAVHPSGEVYVADPFRRQVLRYDAAGTYLLEFGAESSAAGIIASGNTVDVASANGVTEFEYPTTPLAKIRVTANDEDVTAPATITLHVTIDNLGGVPLTGVSTTSTAAPDCARSVADVPVGSAVAFDCTRALTAADSGQFRATVAVQSAETSATSDAITVDVSAFGAPSRVRQWFPSATGLEDSELTFPVSYDLPDLTTDASGDVFIVGYHADLARARIQRSDGDGVFDQAWSSAGTAPGQLERPSGIAVAPDGDVFTSECGSSRVQRFSAGGAFERAWSTPPPPSGGCSAASVAVGPDGTAYVLDASDARVDRIVGDAYLTGWGSTGAGPGQFDHPSAIATGPDGTVYVVDSYNGRIQRFTATGGFLGSFGEDLPGSATNGELDRPTDLAVDSGGRVFVVDHGQAGDGEVQVFTATGGYLARWRMNTARIAVHTDVDGAVHAYVLPPAFSWSDLIDGVVAEYVFQPVGLLEVGLEERTPNIDVGQTETYDLDIQNVGTVPLTSVTIDASGLTGCGGPIADIAVGEFRRLTCTRLMTRADVGRRYQRVRVDSAETPSEPSDNTAVNVRMMPVVTMGGTGTGPGRLRSPGGIATTWSGDLFVADCGNSRVVRFTKDGRFVSAWGSDRLRCPTDLTINSQGHVLVLDRDRREVFEFQANGSYVRSWASRTTSEGTPAGIDVDDADNVYVADGQPYDVEYVCEPYPYNDDCHYEYNRPPHNNLVHRFGPSGSFLGEWGSSDPQIELPGRIWIDDGVLHNFKDRLDPITGAHLAGGSPCYSCNHTDVAVDRFGNTWVTTGGKLQLFQSNEPTSLWWSRPYAEWDQLHATGVTVDRDNVYVVTSDDTVVRLGTPAPLGGTVVADDTGAPTSGVLAVALRASDLGLAGGAVTDGAGRYQLDVPAGDYLLEFAGSTPYQRFEWYDDQPNPPSFDVLTRVTVGGSGSATANAGLARTGGDIAGTLGVTGGGSADGLYVIALRGGVPAGIAVTDAAGQYRLADLAPASYTLVFLDPRAQRVPEFFSDSPGPAGAAPVAVTAGTTATANATLAPQTAAAAVGTSWGIVTDDLGQPVEGALVVALRTSDLRMMGAALTQPDGSYFVPLPAGSVYLEFADPTGTHQFEWFDDEPNPATFGELTQVSPGTNADAVLHATVGAISGRVTDATSGAPLRGAWVVAVGASGNVAAVTAADGGYRLGALAPGTYRLVFVDPTGGHRPEFHADQSSPDAATPVTVAAAHVTTVDAGLS